MKTVGLLMAMMALPGMVCASEESKEEKRVSPPVFTAKPEEKAPSEPPACSPPVRVENIFSVLKIDEAPEPTVEDDGNVFIAYVKGKQYGKHREYSEACINLHDDRTYGIVIVDDGVMRTNARERGESLKQYCVGTRGMDPKLFAKQVGQHALAQMVCNYLVTHVTDVLRIGDTEGIAAGLVKVQNEALHINPTEDTVHINLVHVDEESRSIRGVQVGTSFGAFMHGDGIRYRYYARPRTEVSLHNVNQSHASCIARDSQKEPFKYVILKGDGLCLPSAKQLVNFLNDLACSEDPKKNILGILKHARAQREEAFALSVAQQKRDDFADDQIFAEIQDSTVMYIPLSGKKSSSSSSSKDSK